VYHNGSTARHVGYAWGCFATGRSSTRDLMGIPSILSFPLLLARTVTPTGFDFTLSSDSPPALTFSPIRILLSTINTFWPSTAEKLGFTAPAILFSPSLCRVLYVTVLPN